MVSFLAKQHKSAKTGLHGPLYGIAAASGHSTSGKTSKTQKKKKDTAEVDFWLYDDEQEKRHKETTTIDSSMHSQDLKRARSKGNKGKCEKERGRRRHEQESRSPSKERFHESWPSPEKEQKRRARSPKRTTTDTTTGSPKRGGKSPSRSPSRRPKATVNDDIKKFQQKMNDSSHRSLVKPPAIGRAGSSGDLPPWKDEQTAVLTSAAAATAASASALATIAALLMSRSHGQVERDPDELADLLSQAASAASAAASSASAMVEMISHQKKGFNEDMTETTDIEDDSLDALRL